jgi:hypothetical protein
MEKRINDWFVESVEREMKRGNFYPALYTMLLTVEILSGYMEGGAATVDTFCRFLSHYFNRALRISLPERSIRGGVTGKRANPAQRMTAMEALWLYLRHSFSGGSLPGVRISLVPGSRYYCRYYPVAGLRLDINAFHRDFAAAVRKYCDELVGDYYLRNEFLKRFNSVFSAG